MTAKQIAIRNVTKMVSIALIVGLFSCRWSTMQAVLWQPPGASASTWIPPPTSHRASENGLDSLARPRVLVLSLRRPCQGRRPRSEGQNLSD